MQVINLTVLFFLDSNSVKLKLPQNKEHATKHAHRNYLQMLTLLLLLQCHYYINSVGMCDSSYETKKNGQVKRKSVHGVSRDHPEGAAIDEVDNRVQLPEVLAGGLHLHPQHPGVLSLRVAHSSQLQKGRKPAKGERGCVGLGKERGGGAGGRKYLSGHGSRCGLVRARSSVPWNVPEGRWMIPSSALVKCTSHVFSKNLRLSFYHNLIFINFYAYFRNINNTLLTYNVIHNCRSFWTLEVCFTIGP